MRGGEERFLTFGAPDGDTSFAWYFTPASGDFPLQFHRNCCPSGEQRKNNVSLPEVCV